MAIYGGEVTGAEVLGLSVGWIAMISRAVVEMRGGVVSDLIGRKYTTMLSGLCLTLMGIAYAIGLSYGWLVMGAILEGLARALNSGNNDALLYDSLKKSDRKEELEKFMGQIGAAEQWASGIAAVLGGILAAISFKLAMWLSVIPLLLCFVTSWWLIEVKNEEKGGGNVYLHLKDAIGNF